MTNSMINCHPIFTYAPDSTAIDFADALASSYDFSCLDSLNLINVHNAFHEKAGRSQVGSFVFSLDKVFLRPS
jgi:hypothetical protein